MSLIIHNGAVAILRTITNRRTEKPALKFSVRGGLVGCLENVGNEVESRVAGSPEGAIFPKGRNSVEGGRRILFEISSRPRKHLCRAICQPRLSSPLFALSLLA